VFLPWLNNNCPLGDMKRINITNTFILLFVSFLLGVFWVRPQYQKLKEKNKMIFQREIVVRSAQQRREKIQSLEEELKKYSKQMEIIKTAISEHPSLLSFLNYLQKTASDHGLLIRSYSYSRPGEKTPARESNVQTQKKGPSFGPWIPGSTSRKKKETASQPLAKEGARMKATEFNLSLSGTYSGFLGFLSSLEKSSRLIEIDQISLSSVKEDQPTNFEIKLKIYSY